MGTLLTEIQANYSSFSDKEKGLADYLLSSPEEASHSNIKEIALKTGVSVATVTRFCKKVSCTSFVELKLKLAREGHSEADDSIGVQLKQQYESSLRDIEGLNEDAEMLNVLRIIEGAAKVHVYGLGSSGLAAQELNYRLSRMGFNSEAVTDPHLMIIRSTLLQKDDVLIAISRSGQTRDLLTSVRRAKERGVKLVSITAYGDAPLTKISEAVLLTLHPLRTRFISTGLDLSTLYLIDFISSSFMKDADRSEIYEQTVQAISNEAWIDD